MEGAGEVPLMHLLFVPEGEFQPIVNSDLGVDGTEIVPKPQWGNTEVVGDFAILQSLGHHFDDSELTRVRRLKAGLCYQQMPKLTLQVPPRHRIRHFGEVSEQLANAFLFLQVWVQGKNYSPGIFKPLTTRSPVHKATTTSTMVRTPIMW